ncbi:non-heme iron oxygenase ferredoxin subunit [Planosporangium flavigriseum]|uniref:(2Fe-2S)-binding protein n=1 Tax=Planosporangium flavigriseum TaxID=373681 RepID=A0A8J3PKF5_9ACTN|nr:non-heme iron oxygenase ferredoxin subunit [Planosporangium flavigriseum]NJC65338.1 non-heme iron oxygenase ferredoxin subunit [Planosporangium flavigriseum]GIG73306.1 (2Fe-2S)-binding protein [Planosporangium flavigriseum]
MTSVRICRADELAKGEVIAVTVDDTPLAVVHCEDDSFHAVYDECSHASIPLSEGEVDGCTLECWLHGSRFDLRTGKPSGPPATEPVTVYSVEVRDGDIYVNLSEESK